MYIIIYIIFMCVFGHPAKNLPKHTMHAHVLGIRTNVSDRQNSKASKAKHLRKLFYSRGRGTPMTCMLFCHWERLTRRMVFSLIPMEMRVWWGLRDGVSIFIIIIIIIVYIYITI